MKVAISAVMPFHAVLMADALGAHADSISIYSSAPRKFFRHLDSKIPVHLVPAPLHILARAMPLRIPAAAFYFDGAAWDRAVSALMPKADVVIGLASLSLATGRGANRRQAKFVLDRACPHVDFQQKLVCDESQKVGIKFKKQPRWFRERQLEEYEIADLILTPSRYTAQTFPEHLRHKVHIAPLMGRTRTPGSVAVARHQTFTVGMVGLEPLRKGYLYLLEAWKQLALPNAKLLIRSSADFSRYGRLQELLKELPNVEVVPYVPDMANFYALCDVFVLPSMDDGFGMALFEAMANGRPCITTRNCGASELLTNGVDGIVIDAGDSRQIAEAVLQLYREDELRQSIALAGKATAERVKDTALYEQALVGGLQLSR